MVSFERAMVGSYRPRLATVWLSYAKEIVLSSAI